MNSIEVLKEKVELLINQYNSKSNENKELLGVIESQKETILQLNGKIATLESEVEHVKHHKIEMAEEEKENMRIQLDGLIQDIDKILSTNSD